jgi:hypothetical protein
MLDAPAYDVLWQIAAETGVRPEYLLPVLSLESGFNPAISNGAGAPYYGINQASVYLISTYAGVDPQTYLTWPASRQLSTVVEGMLKELVSSHGPLRSATRVYQGNFLPATLASAKKLTDVITSAPSAFYTANSGLDVNHDGAITVGDLAAKMAHEAKKQAVQDAIRAAYAAREGASPLAAPTDVSHIVYGDDFGLMQEIPWIKTGLIAAGILAVGGGIIYAIETHKLDKFILPRRRRR